ncbi:hypothetical protein SAMN05660860_02261 [Geoalkalibacter ferrihydriticus]|uniref:Uncharacterized protein n=2 Tax=Geoalkalibacter ferrihydriticus TaxID=392333 RepID=A0A0C2HTC5_9BACT|nr:hypothetical protein GFER_05565 [Geoalkalibacter ferrihydriticus DSM 17813]SDM31291.1 hypothetical protein SAMN05660860_02261 [Geoalkalibacter ferrihydriticus]
MGERNNKKHRNPTANGPDISRGEMYEPRMLRAFCPQYTKIILWNELGAKTAGAIHFNKGSALTGTLRTGR